MVDEPLIHTVKNPRREFILFTAIHDDGQVGFHRGTGMLELNLDVDKWTGSSPVRIVLRSLHFTPPLPIPSASRFPSAGQSNIFEWAIRCTVWFL